MSNSPGGTTARTDDPAKDAGQLRESIRAPAIVYLVIAASAPLTALVLANFPLLIGGSTTLATVFVAATVAVFVTGFGLASYWHRQRR